MTYISDANDQLATNTLVFPFCKMRNFVSPLFSKVFSIYIIFFYYITHSIAILYSCWLKMFFFFSLW